MSPQQSRFRSLLLALLLLSQHLGLQVTALPRLKHEVEDLKSRVKRQQIPTVAITGITEFGIQPRLEIRQLEQNTDQWNIFLLGLTRFQQTNQSDLTSYYQIAGIHGRPYIPWDNVPPAPGLDSPGYCAHVINLFLSWHRPYLALFEQTLFQHIVDAVNEFPEGSQRQRYASAALSWRVPYFDWAMTTPAGQPAFPTCLQSPTVTVNTPNGTAVIHNPLYSYRFHPVSVQDFYFSPFALWNETKRYPTSWAINATSQDSLLGPIFANNQVSFQDRLYNLFTYYDNFTEFGNEAWMEAGVSNADSLESIHDVIHSIIGSNGHMTYLDYSAFDPSFWLHHAMIDRCFALWQVLYPNSYVEPAAAIEQTYTIAVGSIQNENSALEPFFSDDQRDYWTPASTRSINTFGYTYPELMGSPNVSAVKVAINTLYGGGAASGAVSRRALQKIEKREMAPGQSHAPPNKTSGEVNTKGQYREYMANILSDKFALNGSYAIYIFLGDFSDNATTWPTSPNLVGTHAVFAALSFVDAASNPQSKTRRSGSSAIQVTGSMPLTSMLMSKVQSGDLSNMTTSTVEEYLEQNLHWRVAMFDGTEVPVQDLAGLTVTVVSAEVQPATSLDEFPQWSNFTKLTHITQGRVGGCQV